MDRQSMKKAPGGCGDIHQGRNAEHCYENICIITKIRRKRKGVWRCSR